MAMLITNGMLFGLASSAAAWSIRSEQTINRNAVSYETSIQGRINARGPGQKLLLGPFEIFRLQFYAQKV